VSRSGAQCGVSGHHDKYFQAVTDIPVFPSQAHMADDPRVRPACRFNAAVDKASVFALAAAQSSESAP
jgi:hypothetical protein